MFLLRKCMAHRIAYRVLNIIVFITCVMSSSVMAASFLQAPHDAAHGLSCMSCHRYPLFGTSWPPDFPPPSPTVDDTFRNFLCLRCHDGTVDAPDEVAAPVKGMHSSLFMNGRHTDWTTQCVDCHDPHFQAQLQYQQESGLFLARGMILALDTVSTPGHTIVTGAFAPSSPNWTDTAKWPGKNSAGRGLIFVVDPERAEFTGEIVDVAGQRITVAGILPEILTGKEYGVIYGQLVRARVRPPVGPERAVRFFDPNNNLIDPAGNPAVGGLADERGTASPEGVCQVCHTETSYWRNDGTRMDHNNGQRCTNCHAPEQGFSHSAGGGMGENCSGCHGHDSGFSGTGSGGRGSFQSHSTHTENDADDQRGPAMYCDACHDPNKFPSFRSGTDSNGDGLISLAETDVCNPCHSPGGVYDGVNDPDYGARANWRGGIYETNGDLKPGKEKWCISCHDDAPAVIGGAAAPNKAGDGSSYGYYLTGHGAAGSSQRLSWQDTTAQGNPGANRGCTDCHDSASDHIATAAPSGSRLKTGFENDQNNSNCVNCHRQGGVATAGPVFFTDSATFENSAHGGKLCTDCHDVHGADGGYPGMTKADRQNLCNQCHAGIGGHPGVGSAAFAINGKSYTLECVSCHNVHVITGAYSEAGQNKSPVSLFSANTEAWGDSPAEKMAAYAGSGSYRKPGGESFTGDQLPDYATFCLDCHGQPGNPPFGINWNSDPHGKNAANQPNGYGACPNWFACGKAFGWDNDTCVDTQEKCWPVTPRGAGDQLFSRQAYTHAERVAGANFTLSCTDCHTGHGSGTLGRPNVNGGSFTPIWNTMCNNCHYYYSDWHAGMSCANASCHVSDRMNQTGTATIHGMANNSGSGGTRTHSPGLVLNYAFENNLKDSGGWEMDGKWFSATGTFASGKTGQAAVLGEDIGVQVGTENAYWSTDAGQHGTWVYTEMKYNTTLEAWVNPTDNAKSEYTIFTKHVGIGSGGYSLTLKKIGGSLRLAMNIQADNNGFAQDGRAGIRGAYSSVSIPLNRWTHVGATFDANGPDRDPADPSVGRIRIYVNGEDVTTSDASGNNLQPGANETSIFAYSENSPWNETICYDGHWCASEFSIGGFDWETTNFIGRIDEARVWNITKDAAYFAANDQQAGPYISSVSGLIGGNQLAVTFSEGVFTNSNGTGPLQPADFSFTDAGGNNPGTITGVNHTAGASTATITMSRPLTVADVNADTIAAANGAIFDNHGNHAGTETTAVGLSAQCPSSPVRFELNEPAGSTNIMDSQGVLYGAVSGGAAALTGSEFSGGGDNSGRYIMFDYNPSCLQASTAMTIEARIKPTGLSGTANSIRRILARDGGGNFQLSVWRNNAAYPGQFNAPAGEASIALWVNPVDAHGGNAWKPVLTNYSGAKTGSENDCPIVSDHWYLVKAVWNTDKPGGVPGQFFTPADIYLDDQGTDGNGAGENWAGYVNCTDTDQSLKTDIVKFSTGDAIKPYSGDNFAIGANRTNPANNLFNGLIDWLVWKDTAD